MNEPAAFDFIVTGAGSAGCAVAGRLSEDGKYRVLLLEAGPPDRNPWIHIPLGYTQTYTDPKVNWMFESEPEPQMNGRTLYVPRGNRTTRRPGAGDDKIIGLGHVPLRMWVDDFAHAR